MKKHFTILEFTVNPLIMVYNNWIDEYGKDDGTFEFMEAIDEVYGDKKVSDVLRKLDNSFSYKDDFYREYKNVIRSYSEEEADAFILNKYGDDGDFLEYVLENESIDYEDMSSRQLAAAVKECKETGFLENAKEIAAMIQDRVMEEQINQKPVSEYPIPADLIGKDEDESKNYN